MAAAVASHNVSSSEARGAAQQYLDGRLKPATSSESTQPFVVPVIDISNTFEGSKQDKAAAAAKIREACLNSGFFQITGNGVSSHARQGIIDQSTRLFKNLTPAQKQRMHAKNSNLLRGWEPAEYTYVNPSDWNTETVPETKKGFNWGYETRLDPTGGDRKFQDLDGTPGNGNVWPKEHELPGFFDGVKEYYSAVLQLARHLSRLFALSLELPEDFFDEMTTHPGGIARLLYYPPSKDPKPLDNSQKDEKVGLGAHSDYENFTILLSSTKHGLEVLSPYNLWHDIEAAEDGLVVNVGDFFMRWTNGLYKSTMNRVVNRTTKERYSVPLFFSVNYDQLVEVSAHPIQERLHGQVDTKQTLPSCISEENPSQYPPVHTGEYILERTKATLKNG